MRIIVTLCFGVLMNLNLFAQDFIKIHYQRLESDYENWSLWIWDACANKPGFAKERDGIDSFGAYFNLNVSQKLNGACKIGILPRYGEWINKEAFDRVFEYSGQKEIFIVEGEKEVFFTRPEISTTAIAAYAQPDSSINLFFNRKINDSFIKSKEIKLFCLEKPINFSITVLDQYSNYAVIRPEENISRDLFISGSCIIKGSFFQDIKVDPLDLFYSLDYYYDGPLGVLKEGNKTVFRVFSPMTKAVSIILKEDPQDLQERRIPLEKKEKGIWEYTTQENLEGFCYLYEADYGDRKITGVDPYGKSVIGDKLCSVIFNDDGEEVYPSPSFPISKTVIYEMSVRDMTSDVNCGVKNPKKYLGLTEENTFNKSFPEIKTGLAHIKELGVNAVHIMPIQDFENDENSDDYNWGYMPVNFNSPEGQYAIEKHSIGRVRELKKMISAFHKNGIKVILDVVYNHTAETKDKIYNFNALAYDYFYRRKQDGSYYNGSGCGNEFKSEAPMARKFILDSLKYWVKKYKIDGFRFDLMGLIDEETAFQIVEELKKINPEIIIYGEPWHAGGTPVKGISKGSQKNRGFSVFNDDFRDAIKGSVFDVKDLGYVQSGNYSDKVKKGIVGSLDNFTASPYESINYVSCHDNHTLFDRIDLSVKNETLENKIKMDKLAQAIVFFSQGIPFLHSGEEILRTKKGEENSYNLGDDINKIDWNRKKQYYDVFSYYRDLIKVRKDHPAFFLSDAASVRKNLKFYEDLGLDIESPRIAFVIDGDDVNDSWGKIVVLINPLKQQYKFQLPPGNWNLRFSESGINSAAYIYNNHFIARPISLYVLSSK